MGIDEDASLLDAKTVAGLFQDMAVGADIFTDTLVAAKAIADEIGRNRYEVAIYTDDAHVGDHATRTGFRELGVAVRIEHTDDALADALAKESGSLLGARILIPNASDARDTLTAGLQKHGASVESIPVYRTVPAKIDLRGLADDIKIGRIDAVTFTSSSTVRYFMDLVGRDAAISGQFVAATIGPITGATARELGLRDVMEAEPHTVPGLVESLVRRFA